MRTFSSLLFLLLGFPLFAQMNIYVDNIPQYDVLKYDSILYIAGDFNGWDPNASPMTLLSNGVYQYTIPSGTNGQTIAYKFTRGSWDAVETDANYNFIPDHEVSYSNGSWSYHTIQNWEDMEGFHSVEGNTYILRTSFSIPQLSRDRRVWIYLPPNYHTSSQTYPVLYMHDGQNLFDDAFTFSGEWGIDESMNALFANGDPGAIVVGIDNGGIDRLSEYSAWPSDDIQYQDTAQGIQYMDFLVNTLKPYIDANFRTKPDRANTAIMGSSMGGLISMFGAVEYQNVFSKAGIFSPSFWFTQQAFQHVSQKGAQFPMRFYFMSGTTESSGMLPDMTNMYNTCLSAGFNAADMAFVTHSDGQHSEWFWRREFPDAYLFLFQPTTGTVQVKNEIQPFQVSPLPAENGVDIRWENAPADYAVALFSSYGQNVRFNRCSGNAYLDLNGLAPGVYLLMVEVGEKVYRKKILKAH